MLYAYNLFHLNLAYSAIENEANEEVIERCYWPLLDLVKDGEIPVGIELPGYTLERIAAIDPQWIVEFKTLLEEKKCELIGCGYSQLISPLVPAELNRKNIELGNDTYRTILGTVPQIVLFNEQAYSAGTIDVLAENGVKAVIMEWNNPSKSNKHWSEEWRYLPQRAVGSFYTDGLPIIWNESIGFQKFQRYAHGQINLAELMSFTLSHKSDQPRAVPLYGNDVEIFDFRPGRYMTEAVIQPDGEWNRINAFYKEIKNRADIQIIAPSDTLELQENSHQGHHLNLQTAECPIPVKKQAKYNVVRWGLTGRDDLKINTMCWQIFDKFKENEVSQDDWKELCYLWSSDFRTHITDKRWSAYERRLQDNHAKFAVAKASVAALPEGNNEECTGPFDVKRVGHLLEIKSDTAIIRLNCLRGLALDSFVALQISEESLIGTVHHGTFSDIDYSADFFSGHLQAEVALKHKVTDLNSVEPTVTLLNDQLLVSANIKTPVGTVEKIWAINSTKPSLTVHFHIDFDVSNIICLRLGYATLNETLFRREDLFFATHNGGDSLEFFPISKDVRDFDHGAPVSSLVSANQALGMTEGYFYIGDNQKGIILESDKTEAATLGLVSSRKIRESHFTRFCFSLLEHDDTTKGRKRLVTDISFKMHAVNPNDHPILSRDGKLCT